MNYSDQIIEMRNNLIDELTETVLISESELDERWNDEGLEELYYALPSTVYYDKHGLGSEVKIIGYKGGNFQCYDDQIGEIYEVEPAWISTDALVEFHELTK